MNSLSKQTREQKRSQTGKREVILRLLKEAGSKGLTNLELAETCLRPGARIFELRKRGLDIQTVKDKQIGVYRYIYRGLAQPKQRSLFAA